MSSYLSFPEMKKLFALSCNVWLSNTSLIIKYSDTRISEWLYHDRAEVLTAFSVPLFCLYVPILQTKSPQISLLGECCWGFHSQQSREGHILQGTDLLATSMQCVFSTTWVTFSTYMLLGVTWCWGFNDMTYMYCDWPNMTNEWTVWASFYSPLEPSLSQIISACFLSDFSPSLESTVPRYPFPSR